MRMPCDASVAKPATSASAERRFSDTRVTGPAVHAANKAMMSALAGIAKEIHGETDHIATIAPAA